MTTKIERINLAFTGMRINKNNYLALVFLIFISSSAYTQNGENGKTCETEIDLRRNSECKVNIIALQAGTQHYLEGNPGLEANFVLFKKLVREAALSHSKPDLICFPEYAISGWPYPNEEIINSIGEIIPGNGKWYQQYVELARETGVALAGWLVEMDQEIGRASCRETVYI